MQGTLAFYDPMSDNSSIYEWSINSAEVGSCSFQQGAYHAMMNAVSGPARFHPCLAQASPRFSKFAYEVHMKIITGACGGLLFRANNPKFYYFYICTNSTYGLVRYTANTSDTRVNPVLTQQYYSDLIKQGLNQENLLAVVANGPKIDLYVNQNKLDSVTDAAYSQGNIGVLARREVVQTDTAFSSAKVWIF
jgi:hypothetical protein